jgi:hypothetical protein
LSKCPENINQKQVKNNEVMHGEVYGIALPDWMVIGRKARNPMLLVFQCGEIKVT